MAQVPSNYPKTKIHHTSSVETTTYFCEECNYTFSASSVDELREVTQDCNKNLLINFGSGVHCKLKDITKVMNQDEYYRNLHTLYGHDDEIKHLTTLGYTSQHSQMRRLLDKILTMAIKADNTFDENKKDLATSLKENLKKEKKDMSTDKIVESTKEEVTNNLSNIAKGMKLAGASQAGETMLELYSAVTKDVPMAQVLLSTPDGREFAKFLSAGILHAVAAQGVVPQAYEVGRVCDLVQEGSSMKLVEPYMADVRKYATQLAGFLDNE